MYEVPYCIAGDMPQRARQFVDQLGPTLAEGRRGDALELFMRFAGSSEDEIAGARDSQWWPGLMDNAHTLAYDTACMNDYQPPTARLATIRQPTLVVIGGLSPTSRMGMSGLPPDFFEQATDAIVASVPHAERQTLEDQSHVADPKVVVPVLERFFTK